MNLYLQAREGTPEGESLKYFVNKIFATDPDAEINDKSNGAFLVYWVDSKNISGYFQTSIKDYLRVHKKDDYSDGAWFDLYILESITLTIYELYRLAWRS